MFEGRGVWMGSGILVLARTAKCVSAFETKDKWLKIGAKVDCSPTAAVFRIVLFLFTPHGSVPVR